MCGIDFLNPLCSKKDSLSESQIPTVQLVLPLTWVNKTTISERPLHTAQPIKCLSDDLSCHHSPVVSHQNAI